MKKILKWIIIVFVALVAIGIISSAIENEHGGDLNKSVGKGYVLNEKELAILNYLLEEDAVVFSRGGGSFLESGLISVSAKDVEKEYGQNQVAADQKYFKKVLFVAGAIANINSGIGNEPYVTLRGINPFMSPQIHFESPNIEKISMLRKGQKANFVCWGGGAILGTPMFRDCKFSDDYANEKINEIKSQMSEFLQGEKPAAGLVANKFIYLPAFAIAMAKSLPDTSSCFNGGDKCRSDIDAFNKDKNIVKQKMDVAWKDLKSSGVQVPDAATLSF